MHNLCIASTETKNNRHLTICEIKSLSASSVSFSKPSTLIITLVFHQEVLV